MSCGCRAVVRTNSALVAPYRWSRAWGSAPNPARSRCLLDLHQRARPFGIYQLGFVFRGGPTRTLKGHGRPSPENKPINGFEGPLPFAELQEAEPLGGGSGRSPAPDRRCDATRSEFALASQPMPAQGVGT